MEPILALAAIKTVGGILSNLMAPAPPRTPYIAKAPVAKGAFVKSKGAQFNQLLNSKLGQNPAEALPFKFTPEAAAKLEMMGVRLTQTQYEKLMEGVKEAAAKGSRQSLVMMDGLAFVVDVGEGKILDVSDRNRLDTKVYTKIDSVVETRI